MKVQYQYKTLRSKAPRRPNLTSSASIFVLMVHEKQFINDENMSSSRYKGRR